MRNHSWNSRTLVLVGMVTAVMCVAAFIRIPIPPVAISLQSLAALLAGLILGPRLGPLSQLVYIGLGLVGVPVFTSGGGFAYLFRPSFGYILGFIPAAWLVGQLNQGQKQLPFGKLLLIAVSAHLMIYAIDVPYLYIALRYFGGTPVTLFSLLKTGFLIFLPGDLLKSVFFVAVAPRISSHHTVNSFRESC